VEQHSSGVHDATEQGPLDVAGPSPGRLRVAGGDRLASGVDEEGRRQVDVGQRPGEGVDRGRAHTTMMSSTASPSSAPLRPAPTRSARQSVRPQPRRRTAKPDAAATLPLMLALVFLLVIVPVVELAVFVQIASSFGVWNTVAVLLAISLIGAWIVKHQGMAVWRRAQMQINAARGAPTEAGRGLPLLLARLLLLPSL